jgi:hypothetical protein
MARLAMRLCDCATARICARQIRQITRPRSTLTAHMKITSTRDFIPVPCHYLKQYLPSPSYQQYCHQTRSWNNAEPGVALHRGGEDTVEKKPLQVWPLQGYQAQGKQQATAELSLSSPCSADAQAVSARASPFRREGSEEQSTVPRVCQSWTALRAQHPRPPHFHSAPAAACTGSDIDHGRSIDPNISTLDLCLFHGFKPQLLTRFHNCKQPRRDQHLIQPRVCEGGRWHPWPRWPAKVCVDVPVKPECLLHANQELGTVLFVWVYCELLSSKYAAFNIPLDLRQPVQKLAGSN